MIRFIIVFSIIYTAQGAFPSPSRGFLRSEDLVTDKYRLLWNIEDDNITVEVQVLTKGWVGFGLSPNGGMKGSDVVIGWVQDGKHVFHVSLS